MNLAVMDDKERKVYGLIRAHYLAHFLPHHEYDQTVAHLDCTGHILQANGQQIIASVWQQALGSGLPTRVKILRLAATPAANRCRRGLKATGAQYAAPTSMHWKHTRPNSIRRAS